MVIYATFFIRPALWNTFLYTILFIASITELKEYQYEGEDYYTIQS